MKVNYVTFRDGKLVWKQIETRNGRTYMRIKQRTNFMLDLGQNVKEFGKGYSINY